MSVTACPACSGVDVRTSVASRKTGRVVATCRSCGCHWLANPAPHDEIVESYDFDREHYAAWVAAKRHDTLVDVYASTLDRLASLIESGDRQLFDVGAGAGEFLAMARDRGFAPHGNELAPGAIELARDLNGVELHHGDLASIDGENLYDAVTMWCVLAHVSDPDALLRDVLRILKPGGVLFLQTPRWSAMDTMGHAAARLSRGRWTRVLDRRVTDAHMVLTSADGLRDQAGRAGFDVVDVTAISRYSMKTTAYLESLGVPDRASRAAAAPLDLAVDRNLFFRNIVDLYARKPR